MTDCSGRRCAANMRVRTHEASGSANSILCALAERCTRCARAPPEIPREPNRSKNRWLRNRWE